MGQKHFLLKQIQYEEKVCTSNQLWLPVFLGICTYYLSLNCVNLSRLWVIFHQINLGLQIMWDKKKGLIGATMVNILEIRHLLGQNQLNPIKTLWVQEVSKKTQDFTAFMQP